MFLKNMQYKTISIIIPVYNEEQFIKQIFRLVIKADTLRLKKEVIIIDDFSTDNTLSTIKNEIKKHKQHKIILIKKSKNEGKGAAIKAGFLRSTGDIVIIQDADLEYSQREYPSLLEPFYDQTADVVFGSRFLSNKQHRVLYFWHAVVNRLLTTFSNMFTDLNLTDMETGYKVFRGSIIRQIAPQLRAKRFGFEPEITARLAKNKQLKIYEVGISYSGRTYAEGKKIGWKDGIRAIGEIIYYNLIAK